VRMLGGQADRRFAALKIIEGEHGAESDRREGNALHR